MIGGVKSVLTGFVVAIAMSMAACSVGGESASETATDTGTELVESEPTTAPGSEPFTRDPTAESRTEPVDGTSESHSDPARDPGPEPEPEPEPEPSVRTDVWLRPFQSTSIWNMPIGSDARYLPAELPLIDRNLLTDAYLLALDASDPQVDVIAPGTWTDRCSGTESSGYTLNLPGGYIVEPPSLGTSGAWRTPNNGFAFLLPDGRTIFNGGQGARCAPDGPLFGHTNGVTETDLYGDGRGGGHGSSHLSVLGGAIRPGELTGDGPIRHVLDLAVFSKYLYSDGKQTKASTFRWPATSSDSYALDPDKADRYVGDLPDLRIGSLLAIPPDLSAADLDVETSVGRKLFDALRDYGAYITEDSAWEANLLLVDTQAEGEFEWGERERSEFGRMVASLHVITNNGPDSIGGGGAPRRPLLPPLPDPPVASAQPVESAQAADGQRSVTEEATQ